MCSGKPAFAFYDIMVSINGICPPSGVIAGNGFKALQMHFFYFTNRAILPQFVSIAQFQVGETIAVIVIQGRQIQILIFQKIVVGVANASVAVAEQNIFCVTI